MTMIDDLGQDLREKFPDLWLGTLVWYYVPADVQITTKDWVKSVLGTPIESMRPTPPRAVDAFKRAIKKIGNNGKVSLSIDGKDVLFRFMSRDSGTNEGFVFRDLVVERLGDNHLSYGPVVKFTHNRSTKDLTDDIDSGVYNLMPPAVQEEVDERIAMAHTQYAAERFVLGEMKVRRLLREEIEYEQMGVPCKPGSGIYFVFDHHRERTEALQQLMNDLSKYGVTFHQMPVINVENQRKMIQQAFENDTLEEVDSLMKAMRETLHGERGKVTKDSAKRFAKDFSRLTARLAEYSDILEQKNDKVGDQLNIMKAQLTKVVGSIGKVPTK